MSTIPEAVASAESCTMLERCERRAIWGRTWTPERLTPTQVLYRALAVGLTSTEDDPGTAAGEEVMRLASSRGLAMENSALLYATAMHHACLADILVMSIRSGPNRAAWRVPDATKVGQHLWTPSCFLGPNGTLRRVVLVSYKSPERVKEEARAYRSLGEVCVYGMPMDMVVVVLGELSEGRRQGYWSRGLHHKKLATGMNELRFRKLPDSRGENRTARSRPSEVPFKETWRPVFREDASFSMTKWLDAMIKDQVFQEVLTVHPVAVPDQATLDMMRTLIETKLDALARKDGQGAMGITACDTGPCPYKACCWKFPQTSPDEGAFLRIVS